MLSIEQLSFKFPSRTILDRVTFHLAPGAVTCLVGGNGSGKTTVFNLVSGFLQPDEGSIQLGGLELVGRKPFQIARCGVARTFQDLRLIRNLSVRENILLALPDHPGERLSWALLPQALHRQRDNENQNLTKELLSEFFLDGVAEQLAAEISYGQQKLLTLACCAALNAPLILLDEPAAGISSAYREKIAERLDRLQAAGKTIMLIEHQADFLERVGAGFLLLRNGRIQTFTSLSELHGTSAARDALV